MKTRSLGRLRINEREMMIYSDSMQRHSTTYIYILHGESLAPEMTVFQKYEGQ